MKMSELTEGRLWAQTEDYTQMAPPPAVYAKYAVSHSQFPELKTISGDISKLAYNKQDLAELQQWLNSNGYDAGAVDGTWGPQTRAALQAFNQQFVDSYQTAVRQRNRDRFFRLVDAAMFVANPAAFVTKRLQSAATGAAVGVVTRAVTGNTST